MRIFIGSSSKSIHDMEIIGSWLEQEGHKAVLWNSHDTFIAGGVLFDSLVEVANSVDAALFVFSEDDQVDYRGQTHTQPRDNVLIEYGLFVGILGTKRVAICRKNVPRIATDLQGILYVDISPGKQTDAKVRIREWLIKVQNLIFQREREEIAARQALTELQNAKLPFYTSGKPSLFSRGTELIKKAKHRVILVARTPIPLVGCRDYKQPYNPIQYELDQFNCYIDIAKRAAKEGDIHFRCVASLDSIRKEIQSINMIHFTQRVHNQIRELCSLADSSKDHKFELRWKETDLNPTFLVADNHFVIWFKLEGGENVWITEEHQPIAEALYFLSGSNSSEIPFENLKTLLDIN